jgi:hypothetical protein
MAEDDRQPSSGFFLETHPFPVAGGYGDVAGYLVVEWKAGTWQAVAPLAPLAEARTILLAYSDAGQWARLVECRLEYGAGKLSYE